MTKKIYCLFIMLAIISVFIFSGAFTSSCEEPIVLRIAGTLPAAHHLSLAGQLFTDEVNKNSNGEIKAEFYPAGQTFNDETMVKAIPQGATEMGICQTANWSGVLPAAEYFVLSTYFDNYDWFKRCCAGEPGQKIISMLEEKFDVKVLAFLNYGICELVSTKPLVKPEDFKGAKLRMLGTSEGLFLQALGGSPISISAAEMYEAIQKGTIEGASTGPSSVISRRLYEVAKYVTIGTQLKETKYFLMINGSVWRKLTDTQRKVLEDAAKVTYDFNADASAKADDESVVQCEEHGVNVIRWSPEEFKKVQEITLPPILDNFKKRVGKELFDELMKMSEALR